MRDIRAGFVYDVRLTEHVYRSDHPLRPERLRGVHETLERLGAFQRPREIEWVSELPMTVSGKIKRAELRQRSQAAAAARREEGR